MASIRQPLIHQNNHQKQPQPQKYRPHQKSPHLPASGNNCERIVQGVAKLSAFRIPPNHLKRCSEGMLPFSEHLICPQPKILINGINARHLEKNSHRPPQLISSSSSNYLLRVNQNGAPAMSGKRMLSLDSCAPLAVGKRLEWLRTQQILVAEAEELARRRKKSCWNGVGASYAFLALSVLLSLSVVIGVCLFLHSFVPKEYYYNATTHNGSSHVNANGQRMGKAVRMDAAGGIGPADQKTELGTGNGNAMEYRTFAEPIKPAEFLMFYKRRRR